MTWHWEQNPARYEQFSRALFGTDDPKKGIAALKAWYKKIGTPVTLAEGNISEDSIPAITENVMGLAKAWGMDAVYNKETVTDILELAR